MIKVTLGEQPKKENEFPKLVTLYRGGGIFIAISKAKLLCLDRGDSGWKVGELNDKDYFEWGETGFVDINKPVTLQNA